MENIREKNEVVEGLTIEQALKKYEPMVNRFVKMANTNNVCSKEDLVQEGRMAIVVAFNYFDPEKGASLTTWTYHMIKDAIIEYQKHNLSVFGRSGAYLRNILRKVGQDATVEEIMEFGISKKTALASTYMKNSFTTVDYDGLESLIEGKPFEVSATFLDWEKYLTKEEAFAVGNYYGFGEQKMTMHEIGQELGKSRKAVSYMINKALVKLRKVPGIEEYAYR